MKNILGYLLVGVLIVTVLAGVLLFTPLGERPLSNIFSIGDIEAVEFSDVNPTDKLNQFLMCPPRICTADRNADSPMFDDSVDRLRERWREVVAAQPLVELLVADQDRQQFDYVQRSARFRFPDIITVRFISVSPSQSTLAIFSRSVYGKNDFGVNRKRIESWLMMLREGP